MYFQALFAAKGIHSNWDRLGNIAAGVHYLQMIKKQVTASIKAGYQGSTHTAVDTSVLVWRIANKARDLELQKRIDNREGNKWMKVVVDVQAVGYKKLGSSSLGTFNKKISAMKEGHPTNMEIDELPSCKLVVFAGEVDDETGENEISVLHDDKNLTTKS